MVNHTHTQLSNDEDDVRLTTFALGETSEHDLIDEASTTVGTDGRGATLDEIRRCGTLVRQSLAAGELPQSSSDLRRAVEARLAELAAQPPVELASRPVRTRRFRLAPLGVAVSILVLLGTVFALRDDSTDIAELPTPWYQIDDNGYLPPSRPGSLEPQSVNVNVGEVKVFSSHGNYLSSELPAGAITSNTKENGSMLMVQPRIIVQEDEKAVLGHAPSPGAAGTLTYTGAVATGTGTIVTNGGVTADNGPALRDLTITKNGAGTLPIQAQVSNRGMPHNTFGLNLGGWVEGEKFGDWYFRDERGYYDAHEQANSEAYAAMVENAFLPVADNPLSTFSIDVDTASYANMRRFLTQGALPPPEAVRIEELINYFRYDYPQPDGDDPFSVNTELAVCPWNSDHRLLRIGLKGREMPRDERPASNLVFLVDVSGSMQEPNKLPLVQESLGMLLDQLGENDRVAIVVYAGSTGLVLPSTNGSDKSTIREAIDRLQAGGSTNGAAGLELAYEVARANLIHGGTNRVILATDGDFNVGVTDRGELVKMIEDKAKGGVFFTALGFGMGNLKDATLEQLADKGNGNYAYIDTRNEARKVLVEELSGTLVTIAKDVKLQLEFNPATVASYRLIGYENRVLAAEDFNNDKKDAGDVGAGHSVTALYEIVLAGGEGPRGEVDPLKYQPTPKKTVEAVHGDELLTLKLRYKQPDAQTSKLLDHVVKNESGEFAKASGDFKFAAAVASFGMLLRHSPSAGSSTFDAVLELAGDGLGPDEAGYRGEFVDLVKRAKALTGK